jgi:hypothetical protein
MDAVLYIQAAREELQEANDKKYEQTLGGIPYYVTDIS